MEHREGRVGMKSFLKIHTPEIVGCAVVLICALIARWILG